MAVLIDHIFAINYDVVKDLKEEQNINSQLLISIIKLMPIL